MSTTLRKHMDKQIRKLSELLEEESFQSSIEGRSEDDRIPYVFCNILEALSDRLAGIEEKLGIRD